MKRTRTARPSRPCATHSQELRARRFFRPLLEQFEDRRLLAAVLTVNSPLDTNVRDSVLTFRESILVSNRTLPVATLTATEQAQVSGTPTSADTDTIAFNIPGTGVQSISTATALPALTDPVVIDGYTQPGASANTLVVGSDAVLLIEVFSTTNQTGLVLSGGGSTIRGLVLNRFFDAVSVVSSNNVIEGNFIGIAADGATDRDNQFNGIRVTAGSNNLIGGVTPAARNVLGGRGFFSGNYSAQIAIGKASAAAAPVVNTTIRGNYIGINAAGTAAVSTASFVKVGVSVGDGVNTIIGGTDADDGTLDGVVHARNVISGNGNGIYAAVFNNGVNSGYLMDGLTIQGNFVGVNATGTGNIANQGFGVFAGEAARSTNLLLGGTAPGAGNVISGNRSSGFIGGALNAAIEGNRVGTDLSGTLDLGNGIDGSAGQGSGGEGIHVSLGGNEGPNFQISVGGTTLAARNIISGNAANGVLVTGIKSGSVSVQGNYIGTKADGQTPLPNLHNGIEMNRSVVIGGAIAGTPNVIAFNGRTGILAPSTSAILTVPILGNSIHSNGNIGIDLNASGVSMNDLGDTDTGINNNGQNFPVLTGINAVGGNTVISGRLNSNASSNYRIEFFYNDARDASGFGEGQTYLGFTDVTTDSSGNVSFSSPVVPGLIPAGRFVTATATKTSTSETSEFSFALASLIVTNTLDSGIGSLREAITMANTFVNFDRDGVAGNDIDPITFAISGAGVQTITPLTALPTIAEAVSIDGYTQPGASPNTLTVGSNAQLLIELNGASAGSSANGLTLAGGGNSTVRGLVVNRFGASGVVFESSNNVVEGSYFGIDAGGTIERSNLSAGVRVNQGTNNRIGGTTTQARNVLAGNGSTTGTAQIVVGFGVGTVLRGNYIGVNAAGTAAVHPTASGNDDGIYVARGVNTIIGGADADDGLVDGVVRAGNVISGNLMGIRINATGSDSNSVNGITIQGNTIGLDATGTVDVGNFGDGVSAVAAAFTGGIVQIGGTQPGAGNVISANDGRGFAGSAANLVLEGNRIGTDISGTLNFGNGNQGVHVLLFGELGLNYQVRVGGTTSAARNIISGNAANGVLVAGETSFGTPVIAIQGNYIGTQADGMSPLPNVLNGVELQRNGSIGGTAAGAGNVIAFNRQRGVNLISGPTMPVLSNSIFSNGAAGNTLSHLGIDLGGNGLTLNDAGDGDFGVNRLQNFPVFGSAVLAAGTVTLQYAVPSSTSNANYPLRIEFFKADGDGQEGQTFLGFDTYTAAEAGTVKTFVLTPAATFAANDKLVATATDNLGNTSEFSASQTVTTANQPPVITSNGGGDTASIAVQENTSAVTTVTASDPDAGTTLTYSIVGGADAGKFSINPTTGGLTFATAPNFELPTDADANNGYLVIVQANDGSLTDTQTLTVTVTNVNEPPAITSNGGGDTASISVQENTTAVTTVTANDPDAGSTLTYSITGGADQAKFAINVSSGALTFIALPTFEAPTDAGADNVYDVVVAASDGSLTDLQTIAVTVTNANESPAITSNGGGDTANVSVPENTTVVTTVTASDPDAGATLTYSINGGADAAKFAIDPSSGALTFVAAPNFESPTDTGADNVYDVVVAASDGSLIDSQTLTVTVTNVNEAPVISSNGGGDSASVNVPENTTAVTTLTALDPDAGTTLTFSISGGADAPQFAINPSSGELTFITAPSFGAPTDADANNSYLVIVQASDGSLTDSQSLTVTVTNINEPPVITSNGGGESASISVPENTVAVTTVAAIDADAATLTYSISGGADAAKFAINPASGVLTFVVAPDFEAPADADANNSFLVIVQASDGSLSDSQTLTVTVTNANELPVITSNGGGNSANISVPENATAVTTVTATDPDVGTTLTYSISGGADAAKFAINPSSGALTFLVPPNFELPTDVGANNMYDVVVAASDGSALDTQILVVNVVNANEPPVITSNGGGDSANVSVQENTTGVTTVTATDPDADTTLTYSISGGADAAKFAINPASGALTFVVAPDFEAPTDADANNTYLVIVQASDGSLTDSQALTVTVTNANESPAITSNGGGDASSVNVPENTTAVTTVTASDPDAGTTLTYSIRGGADAARLTIDPTLGVLTFLTPPNFESPTDDDANNSYFVIVQASDGSLTDLQTLIVNVTNVNESPTITSNGGGNSANISVPENATAVTTVTATDPDVGTTLTYSISGGADATKFAINATTGVLTFVTAPNFESPTDMGGNNVYDVIVQVSDGSLLDTQAISVAVTDVAEAGYTIGGTVFKDVTGNGKSADDLPWTQSPPVTLNLYRDVNGDGVYQSSDTLLASTVTVSGGVYSFLAPTSGKYLLKEVVPNDFVRTFPVLSDYAAVNLTGTTSGGNDFYNAETCDLCVVTNVSYVINHGGVLTTVTDLRGNTHEGDIVTANFTVTATHQVTLVTYNAPGPAWDPVTASQQTVFDFHTATFNPGSHSLTVDIPKNFYQVDLVCGAYINQLGPAGSNIFYTPQNRLISADNGGVNALNAPAIDLALSTSVNNATPLLGSKVVLTVNVANAAGWSAATGVRVKDALPAGLTFVSATATQGTYNSSTGEWNLVNPLNSGATATLTITATVVTAGEKKNSAQVTAAGAPDIDSTPNNDASPSTPHNEDDDDSVSIVPQLWTKYFVVNDSSAGSTREKTFEYASDGTGVENYQLSSGNTAPRGAATTAAGNKVWVIDANKTVYVYDAAGALLGSWSAGGLASNASPEGIATNGTDIWIVDAQQDKVFKFANAASRTSGSQSAASSFALNSGNKNPKDIVASSTHLWVVNDSTTDQVFKYTLAGACVGSWTISGGGGSPTGITLDPANVNHLWVVDKSTDRVYQYDAAASRTSGSQAAVSSFALGSGNTSPEGIADPPPATKQVASHSREASSNQVLDVALLSLIEEFNGLVGSGRRKR